MIPLKLTDEEFEALKVLPPIQLPCLSVAYLLCGLEEPEDSLLLCQHQYLEFGLPLKEELPDGVVETYRLLERTGETVFYDAISWNTSEAAVPQKAKDVGTLLVPPMNKVPTVIWPKVIECCERNRIAIPEVIQNYASSTAAYQSKFQSNVLYRISAAIACWEEQGVEMPSRVLSEPLWGLAAACHIVTGSAVPSKHDNNKGLRLEKDTYDYCVRNDLKTHLSLPHSVSPVYIADFYSYARAAILGGSLQTVSQRESEGRTFYEMDSAVFIQWCFDEGIRLRPDLLKAIGRYTEQERTLYEEQAEWLKEHEVGFSSQRQALLALYKLHFQTGKTTCKDPDGYVRQYQRTAKKKKQEAA
jgi:hypothetical protein